MLELIGIMLGVAAGIGLVEGVDYLRRESPSKVVHVFRSREPVGDGTFRLVEKRRILAKGWFGEYEWKDTE